MAEQDSTCTTGEKPIEYRDIEGFPGYRVGNDGTVWSCWGRGFGAGKMRDKWSQLKTPPSDGQKYYPVVTLCRDGKRFNRYVHALVSRAFLGECPPGLECCHEDGNSLNCAATNLRYDTPKGNQADKVKHGTHSRGERCKTSKLTADNVRFIRANHPAMRLADLGRMFSVTPENILQIVQRKSWAHIE